MPKTREKAHVEAQFVSEGRQTNGWHGRTECDTVLNLWPHPEVFGKSRQRLAQSQAHSPRGAPVAPHFLFNLLALMTTSKSVFMMSFS